MGLDLGSRTATKGDTHDAAIMNLTPKCPCEGRGGALASDSFLPGFETRDFETAGARIHHATGGSGPPLLLLHGHPQTHLTWHKIAPRLAERFTVVAPDLRGYGDSEKLEGGERH